MTEEAANPKRAKYRFFLSLAMLMAGIVYAVYPLDLIPDLLGPIGWVDDIGLLLTTCLYSANAYRKLRSVKTVSQ